MKTATKRILALTGAIAAVVGACVPVGAVTTRTEGPTPEDPVWRWADELLPRNEFVLQSDRNIELVRYKTARDIELCVSRTNRRDAFDGISTVPVKVSWDNDTAEIWPGNCLSFDAKSVKIQPAKPLPDNTELLGTFRVAH